jgi:hypothetical protein
MPTYTSPTTGKTFTYTDRTITQTMAVLHLVKILPHYTYAERRQYAQWMIGEANRLQVDSFEPIKTVDLQWVDVLMYSFERSIWLIRTFD